MNHLLDLNHLSGDIHGMKINVSIKDLQVPVQMDSLYYVESQVCYYYIWYICMRQNLRLRTSSTHGARQSSGSFLTLKE